MDVPVHSTLLPTISQVATEQQKYDAQTKASTHEITFMAPRGTRHLFREYQNKKALIIPLSGTRTDKGKKK